MQAYTECLKKGVKSLLKVTFSTILLLDTLRQRVLKVGYNTDLIAVTGLFHKSCRQAP